MRDISVSKTVCLKIRDSIFTTKKLYIISALNCVNTLVHSIVGSPEEDRYTGNLLPCTRTRGILGRR